MRKILFFLLSSVGGCLFAQAPATINYQGVARDAAGAPITNTTVTLQFKISNSVNPNFYNETQLAVPVNSLGLFSTKIGNVTPLPLNGWQNTPCILQVSIDVNGSGLVPLGSQTLSSVPYALFALNSGGSLPQGTRNGQTLRWDTISNQWLISSNLTSDNVHVGVGTFPGTMNSKMSVATFNPFDTAAFTAVHYVAQNRTAAIRGVAFGSTSGSSTNPFGSAIFGGQHVGYNASNGFAVGSGGFATSKSYGIGLAGFGATQLSSGTAVGLYASVDSTSPGTNKYAAIFDRGAVYIRDSLLLDPLNNPGNIGDVLTLVGNNGRAAWAPLGIATPWVQQTGYIHLYNNGDLLSIGSGSAQPQAKVDITNAAGNNVDALRITDNSTLAAIQINKNLGYGIYISSGNTNTTTAVNISQLGSGNGLMSLVTGGQAIYGTNTSSVPTSHFFNAGPGLSLRASKNNTPGGAALFDINSPTSSADVVTAQTNGFGFAVNAVNSNSSTSQYAGFFGGGIITKGKSANQSDFAFIAKDGGNTDIFTIRNNGFTTLGSGFFSANKLNVEGNDPQTNYFGYAASPSSGLTLNNLNQTNNNFSSISFAASGVESAKIVGVHVNHTNPRGDLVFLTRDPVNINEVLRITSDGHLRAVGTNTNNTCTVSTTFGAGISASKQAGSNDIRGSVMAAFTPSAVVPAGGQITVTVPFDRPYAQPANVVIEPQDQQTATLSHFVSVSGLNSFTIVFFNNTPGGIGLNNLNFKYFVLE